MASQSAHFGTEPLLERLTVYLTWSLGLAALFLATYGTTNWLAAQRATRFRFYFDWELSIPFVPWMIYVYFSLHVLLMLPLFLLDLAGIRRFGQAFGLATLIAGVGHLALPSDLGWVRPELVPGYPVIAKFFSIDRPHNLVPSLHVGYSALAAMVIWCSTDRVWQRALVVVWLAFLICSVLLTHQHHAMDVAGGLVLGGGCYRWFTARRIT